MALEGKYRELLDIWAQYLADYGENPGDQLCTDDFAGHLARNINLAAKAMVGSYLPRMNRYGMALMIEIGIKPLRTYLEETPTRVPFSDWYDTTTGRYKAFIARSVQGGLFIPISIIKAMP